MKYKNILEEELKNTVARDFFGKYDCTKILSKIDFCVCQPSGKNGGQFFLWAEAKAVKSDVLDMLAQLVLTIGRARTYNDIQPPPFLGCFDIQNIVFIPYSEIQDIFYINDFNWNVAPSDRTTKEFAMIRQKITEITGADVNRTLKFDFEKDEVDLCSFIKTNFVLGNIAFNKVQIDKNNFIFVYNKWLDKVKPTIMIDWDTVKRFDVISGDFYLADLLSEDNKTLKEKLFVVLREKKYQMNKHLNKMGLFSSVEVEFTDFQMAHEQFWNIYVRPPREEYWDYIVERRDLLVPQDVRERKGSFYTPQIWVELSQKYLADVYGENWQDEYYIWDCAAGTGNLLTGLTNINKIWASTLDQADVNVMLDRIANGANIFDNQVFQFDFLNDEFSKLPPKLLEIIQKEPEKLIIYINPPYAEAAQYGKSKDGVSKTNVFSKYKKDVGNGIYELFVQFLVRAYKEIPNCKIANFSKLKMLCGTNSTVFRQLFLARLERLFIVPANTFDNVTGQFPIGFHIWDTAIKDKFESIEADVYSKDGSLMTRRRFIAVDSGNVISDWLREHYDEKGKIIGYLRFVGPDFQGNKSIYIATIPKESDVSGAWKRVTAITHRNIVYVCVYFAVRGVIPTTWLNQSDQFLYPNDGWQADLEFQSDCLVYTLFSSKNNISSKHGINHWIPFTEKEINIKSSFNSHFLTDFIKGKHKPEQTDNGLFENDKAIQLWQKPIVFSKQAQDVLDAGQQLYRFYHQQRNCVLNASFYDIREYFQGRNDAGRMNSKSDDEMYNMLLGELRLAMKLLGEKIKPKVYEYGFLL